MTGLLLDENFDLLVTNKKMQLGEIRFQVADILLRANIGEFKELPTFGGEAERMMGGSVNPFWRGEIKTQLKAMKVNVSDIVIDENNIYVTIK